MEALPEELGCLRSLRALRVESNRLRHLPESLTDCSELRVLCVNDNELVDLPRQVCCQLKVKI